MKVYQLWPSKYNEGGDWGQVYVLQIFGSRIMYGIAKYLEDQGQQSQGRRYYPEDEA